MPAASRSKEYLISINILYKLRGLLIAARFPGRSRLQTQTFGKRRRKNQMNRDVYVEEYSRKSSETRGSNGVDQKKRSKAIKVKEKKSMSACSTRLNEASSDVQVTKVPILIEKIKSN